MGGPAHGPAGLAGFVGPTVIAQSSLRRPPRLPLIVLAVAMGLVIAQAVTTEWNGQAGLDEAATDVIFGFVDLAFVAVGALIATRLAGHRVGWAFIAIGFLLIAAGDTIAPNTAFGSVLTSAAWSTAFFLTGFALLWFPTGRLLTPRWRWVEWLGFAGTALVLIGYTFSSELCMDARAGFCEQWVRNPIGFSWIPHPEFGWLEPFVTWIVVVFVLSSVLSLAVRFFRSRGVERQQLKWLLYTMTALVSLSVLEATLLQDIIPNWNWLWAIFVLAIPITTAVAILRYRLYEIDRIASRTAAYALVVGILGLVYTVGAVWLPSSLVAQDAPPLFVAASTLVVAALFNPLRRRVVSWTDRRFYRARYDADLVAEAFAALLRDEVDSRRLTDGWVGAVRRTVQPASLGLWVRA